MATTILWATSLSEAAVRAQHAQKPLLADFHHAQCAGSAGMIARTYHDGRVASAVNERFVPVRIDIEQLPDTARRFNVRRTPTTLVLDVDERLHRRWEGYRGPDEFLAELELARAQMAFNTGRFQTAAGAFEALARDCRSQAQAAEAQYCYGVAEYTRTGQTGVLMEAWRQLAHRYPHSYWARRLPQLS